MQGILEHRGITTSSAYLMDGFLKELQLSPVKQDKRFSYNEKGDEHSRQWVKCVQRHGGIQSSNKYFLFPLLQAPC